MDAETFLIANNLENYVNDCKEHELDLETLLELPDSEVKIFFKQRLGAINRFKKARQELKKNKSSSASENSEKQEIWTSIKQDLSAEYSAGEDDEPECSKSVLTGEIITTESIWYGGADDTGTSNGSKDPSTSHEGRSLSTTSGGEQKSDDEEEDPLASDSTDSDSDSSSLDHSKKRRRSNRDRSEQPPAKRSSSHTTENIVKVYLEQNVVGRGILGSIKKVKKGEILDGATRNKLAHEVVVAELGNDTNKSISGLRFEKLTDGIIELAPFESRSHYFVARVKAEGAQPAVQPKGVLYDKYHNLLRFLRKTGQRNTQRKNADANCIIPPEEDIAPDEQVKKDIEWLEHHSLESQAHTLVKWKATAEYRIRKLQNSEDRISKKKLNALTVDEYISRFPCLSQNWGLNLLLQDFEHMYSGQYTSLIDNWGEIAAKIIKISKQERRIQPGETVKCLKLIPNLFKQPILSSSTSRPKRVWKPNAKESSEGFLLHIKVVSDLENEIKRIKQILLEVQLTLQPFPVVIGVTEDDITDSYVVLDNLRFRVESPLMAIDTCFKIYHSLHCNYPYQSSYSWYFMEEAVYGLDETNSGKKKIVIPSVAARSKQYKDL